MTRFDGCSNMWSHRGWVEVVATSSLGMMVGGSCGRDRCYVIHLEDVSLSSNSSPTNDREKIQ